MPPLPVEYFPESQYEQGPRYFTASLNDPGEHRVHAVIPVILLKVPCRQSRQLEEAAAPTEVEYVPVEQGVHADSAPAPVDDKYFPGEQDVQVSEFGANEYLPAGQFSHVPAEVPEHCTDQNFPRLHEGHGLHVPAEVPVHCTDQ